MPTRHRRTFLKFAGTGIAALTVPGCHQAFLPSSAKAGIKKPNIIFIMADDLGYGDVSCFGSKEIHTPNIDKLAAAGKMFTQSYSGSAVCSPTRASVMTGKYPLRFDIDEHFDDLEAHLPRGVVTLPKLLKKAGYTTAHIGKWHLGGLNQKHIDGRQNSIPGPLQHGFDYYMCNLECHSVRPDLIKERRLYREGGKYIVVNDKNIPEIDKHWTDIKGDQAIELINQYHQQNKPFFLNLWFDVPHTPYEPAPEPHISKYAGPSGEREDVYNLMLSYLDSKRPNIPSHTPKDPVFYRSMISHMDENIGRVVGNLKKLGIYENTLIVFCSDNGPSFQGSTGIFKGGKADLHEGGIRVPMIAVWPGKIPAGKRSNELTSTIDILPTFCAAAGVNLPDNLKIDGVNLLPNFLQDEPVKRGGPIFWQLRLYEKWYPQPGEKPKPYATEVVRDGKWKLMTLNGEPVGLFNIKTDPKEQNNLINTHSDIANFLAQKVRKWLKEPRQSWRDEVKLYNSK